MLRIVLTQPTTANERNAAFFAACKRDRTTLTSVVRKWRYSVNHLGKVLAGERAPSLHLRELIAQFVGVHPEDLWSDDQLARAADRQREEEKTARTRMAERAMGVGL